MVFKGILSCILSDLQMRCSCSALQKLDVNHCILTPYDACNGVTVYWRCCVDKAGLLFDLTW